MPWVKLGRFVLNLSDVLLIEELSGDGEGGVTISLAYPKGVDSSKDVDLVGDEARIFLDLFRKYRGVRSVGLDAPEDAERAGGGPGDAVVHGEGVGVEESPILRPHSTGD